MAHPAQEQCPVRVRKAEEALGYPVDDNRLQVELALLASQWLGATVLRQLGQPQP
jgi:hypothetical protein